MKYFVLICSLLFCFQNLLAQQNYDSLGVDELFELARQKAFNNEREEARNICNLILQKSPKYHDVKILMARTYAWDGNRNEARKLLKEVIQESPKNKDAYSALIDVELWDDKPENALTEVNKALRYYANEKEFLLKKVKAQLDLKQEAEALLTLTVIENIDQGCKECKAIREKLAAAKFKNTVFTNIEGDFYNKYFDPMYYVNIQYGNATKYGSVIARLNYAYRFGQGGIQPEVDYYPGLWKRAYGYLNYGFTTSSLFPRHRIGAEVFQSLPKSLEASVGFRYLYFGGSDVTIYTASLGWYVGNYWLSARTYLTPGNGSISRSLNVSARKYFADANNFIGLTLGAGFSPDQRKFQTNEGLIAGNDIYFLGAQKAEFNFQKSIRYNLILTADVYYVRQELSFSYGEYTNMLGLATGIRVRF